MFWPTAWSWPRLNTHRNELLPFWQTSDGRKMFGSVRVQIWRNHQMQQMKTQIRLCTNKACCFHTICHCQTVTIVYTMCTVCSSWCSMMLLWLCVPFWTFLLWVAFFGFRSWVCCTTISAGTIFMMHWIAFHAGFLSDPDAIVSFLYASWRTTRFRTKSLPTSWFD